MIANEYSHYERLNKMSIVIVYIFDRQIENNKFDIYYYYLINKIQIFLRKNIL